MTSMRKRALDLFCKAGGVSVGLERAGFDVTAVDIEPQPHHRGGHFIQADALTFPLEGFDFIWASPPCQAWTALRHVVGDRTYPELIVPMRERLQAQGAPWCIENVPGAPLGENGNLIFLCGTMFGLQTPDGRAEIRRHRLFETSWGIALRPACQHGHYGGESLCVTGTGMGVGGVGRWAERQVITVTGDKPNSANTPRRALSVVGHQAEISRSGHHRRVICVAGGKAMSGGMSEPQGTRRRRALSVTGGSPETKTDGWTGRSGADCASLRETYSVADARAAMGIDWMPMKCLSQAIPPVYAEWIGKEALAHIDAVAAREAHHDPLTRPPCRCTLPPLDPSVSISVLCRCSRQARYVVGAEG